MLNRIRRVLLAAVLLGAAAAFMAMQAVDARPLPEVGSVSAGGRHTCALTAAGEIQCWGENGSGQLGDGTTVDRPTPLFVQNSDGERLTGMQAVVAGSSHSCGLASDGGVLCWGNNSSGQLGDGTTTLAPVPVVVEVDGAPLVGVTQIVAGRFHTCALTAGAVDCWGANFFGQLGDGGTTNTAVPVSSLDRDGTALAGVDELSAGALHTCAVLAGDEVACWGANFFGQLGDGGTVGASVAVGVVDESGDTFDAVRHVAAGAHHTCASMTNGRVRCWGSNTVGQLGDGGDEASPFPVAVGVASGTELSAIVGLSAGDRHTCAVSSGGAVRCWGANGAGQVGDGATSDHDRAVAVVAVGGDGQLDDVDEVATGSEHTCVVLDTGRVNCWGANGDGQLAAWEIATSATPIVAPYELDGVKDVAVGGAHTCVLSTVNRVACWGANGDGQLGDGSAVDRSLQVAVAGVGGADELTDIKQLVVGRDHSCALTTAGRVRCWGSNFFGQLGDGTTTDAPAPVGVLTPTGTGELSGIKQLSAGAYHTCAALTNGRLHCWGADFADQLGASGSGNRSLPTAVVGADGTSELLGVAEVEAGGFHTCVLGNGGSVSCWGSNIFGQIGDGTDDDATTPTPVLSANGDTLDDAVELSVGEFHACVLRQGGVVACWGGNFFGQLGDTTITDRSGAVTVKGVGGAASLTGAVDVLAGGSHTCAVTSTDRLVCWGGNSGGQLGDGTIVGRTAPVAVGGVDGAADLTEVADVGLGQSHTCALHSDSRLTCWGLNEAGQVGDGSVVDRLLPVRVATNR
ncbi:MAG: RCC1 repeat-containing protein [Actinomycetota bacterium]